MRTPTTTPGPYDLDALGERLADADEMTRVRAATALFHAGAAGLPRLEAAFFRGSLFVRATAGSALALLVTRKGLRGALDVLLAGARHDDPALRVQGMVWLGACGPAAADTVPDLEWLAAADPVPSLRDLAGRTVARITGVP